MRVKDHKTRRHLTNIWPATVSRQRRGDDPGGERIEFQADCSCGWSSDPYSTHPEAWLAAAVHRRNAPRTSGKTRDPRWVGNRREP